MDKLLLKSNLTLQDRYQLLLKSITHTLKHYSIRYLFVELTDDIFVADTLTIRIAIKVHSNTSCLDIVRKHFPSLHWSFSNSTLYANKTVASLHNIIELDTYSNWKSGIETFLVAYKIPYKYCVTNPYRIQFTHCPDIPDSTLNLIKYYFPTIYWTKTYVNTSNKTYIYRYTKLTANLYDVMPRATNTIITSNLIGCVTNTKAYPKKLTITKRKVT